MNKSNVWNELQMKVNEVLASSPAKDIEANMKSALQSLLNKMDLITREEFEVQQAVLLKTREKLMSLEERVALLEQQLGLAVPNESDKRTDTNSPTE